MICLLPPDSSLFQGGLKSLRQFFENVIVPTVEFISRGDIADGAVKADGVVVPCV
jgi:hypothetical protein